MNQPTAKILSPNLSHHSKPDVWGGLECSVVRIRDHYRNQIEETGHTHRIDDLDAIAALGIKTLRYPVLWETTAPDHPDHLHWDWHDVRLARLQQLGVMPIAGLVHHGSGPRYTHLLDTSFPERLAIHAERVAERYPWIDMFTPVNEPLTTARFSGLYGHWYPHRRDTRTLLRALVIQCRAIVLAMRAIRRISPSARLIQTEDLGKAFSTPELKYQADYENERRWLSLDLLCGRLDTTHPWYKTFLKVGIRPSELHFFTEAPSHPDIIGINHYLTSERFLDHRLRLYPANIQSCNAHPRYADVQAVRVALAAGLTGPAHRLREAWERYRLPLAMTEVHYGGAREEQLRWLMEMWQAACTVRAEGVDCRAFTVWSALGCIDWNTLLTQKNGFYESGLFDIRGQSIRPTALATATACLVKTGEFEHPVLHQRGWWQREDRFLHPPTIMHSPAIRKNASSRRLLVTGATGTLGQAFSRLCKIRGLEHDLLTRAQMDIANAASVEQALRHYQPWAIINTAGYVRVAEAHQEATRCHRDNADGAAVLAQACATRGLAYVTFSSDLVFDGTLARSYVESDPVSPLCTYGNSKAHAEQRVLQAWPKALVVRTSAFFGPWDSYNFVYGVLRDLAQGREVYASTSEIVSPTYVPDLVHAILDLLIDEASGIWHLANQGAISWHDLAWRAAQEAGVEHALLKTSDDRRRMTALSSERGLMLPPLTNAIERFVRDACIDWRQKAVA